MTNPKTATVPIIDHITHDHLAFVQKNASLGVFDWNLNYQEIPHTQSLNNSSTVPILTPVMNGAVLMIKKDHFYELGGFDEGIEVEDAARLEMSFKIHLCGGTLLKVPCSRVAKVYKNLIMSNKYLETLLKDNKRVVEVWMKNHKGYIYERILGYDKIDPGDLTEQLAARAKCKPLKYFLDVIAPEMHDLYPFSPPQFAYGIIRLDKAEICLDTMQLSVGESLGLYDCDLNSAQPRESQDFELTYFRDIRLFNTNVCLDTYKVATRNCHLSFGNQMFKYDLVKQSIISKYSYKVNAILHFSAHKTYK